MHGARAAAGRPGASRARLLPRRRCSELGMDQRAQCAGRRGSIRLEAGLRIGKALPRATRLRVRSTKSWSGAGTASTSTT